MLAWALWLGGLVTLFIAVTSLFHTFAADKALAGTAAAGVFRRFESYQLVLAAVAVLAAAAWRMTASDSPRRKTVLLILLVVAAAVAAVSTFFVSNQIHHLRELHETTSTRFRTLHQLSMTLYLAETVVLLLAAMALPANPHGNR
jgi:hypothetical protein